MTFQKQSLSTDEISKGKCVAAVGYFSLFCFIPLAFKKNNRFAVFHAKQGLVLFIGECFFLIVRFIPVIGELFFSFGIVFCVILSGIGIVQACFGRLWEMPVVFEIAENIL